MVDHPSTGMYSGASFGDSSSPDDVSGTHVAGAPCDRVVPQNRHSNSAGLISFVHDGHAISSDGIGDRKVSPGH